jgi:hypothetical protein
MSSDYVLLGKQCLFSFLSSFPTLSSPPPPKLCISVLRSFDPNTFRNPQGLTRFLRPYPVLRSLYPIRTLHYGNQSDSCGHSAMEETSASTSSASAWFLINSRTGDDVNHYRNHPSPIPPLRCFLKNCHQSSTPRHKLSRQTPLTLPLNYFPYFHPIRHDSSQVSVPSAPNHL